MAASIQVFGPASISLDTGTSHALQQLGFTRDGAEIRSNGFFLDVKTDDHGGEAGPPADMEYLGETADITLELTKWDLTVLTLFESRVYGTAASTTFSPAAAGSLMLGGSLAFRLLINPTSGPRNYPVVVFREPIELNKGTKYSTLRIVGTAYVNSSGVLWNTTTT